MHRWDPSELAKQSPGGGPWGCWGGVKLDGFPWPLSIAPGPICSLFLFFRSFLQGLVGAPETSPSLPLWVLAPRRGVKRGTAAWRRQVPAPCRPGPGCVPPRLRGTRPGGHDHLHLACRSPGIWPKLSGCREWWGLTGCPYRPRASQCAPPCSVPPPSLSLGLSPSLNLRVSTNQGRVPQGAVRLQSSRR